MRGKEGGWEKGRAICVSGFVVNAHVVGI